MADPQLTLLLSTVIEIESFFVCLRLLPFSPIERDRHDLVSWS